MIELATGELRLRPVRAEDLGIVTSLGADPRVMASLGGPTSSVACVEWMNKQLAHWRAHAFGRFIVERDGVFVGLVGLSRTDYDAGFTPGIEIAWRLAFDHWRKGYATDAAGAAIRDGFDRLELDEIVGVTTPANERSRRVMERLGMVFSPTDTFEHPLVPEGNPLRTHVVYRLARSVREP